MHVTIEKTPNSLAKKFVLTATNSPFGNWQGTVNYQNTDKPFGDNRSVSAARNESPLATYLLDEVGVFSTAFSPRSESDDGQVVEAHVTVGIKEEFKELWPDMEEIIQGAIEMHEGQFLNENFQPPKTQTQHHAEILDFFGRRHGQAVAGQVEAILLAIETYTPVIKGDGGSLEFKSYNPATSEVFVEMSGACTGCSVTGTTLGNIEEALQAFGMDSVHVINTVQDPRFAASHGQVRLSYDGQMS